jgi:1-deoxy-D-xylulose-5-phosphate synthase
LDTQLLDSLRGSATHIVTFEENSVIGGFGSTVAHYFAQDAIPVTTCGIPDEFVPHGSMSELYQAIGFTPETIADKLDGIL